MNIFVLDKNPLSAAHQMCDKHIPKMIVESAQMLCTAHRICDPIGEYLDLGKNGRKIKRWKHENDLNASKPTLYKAAMINHPCNVWLRESVQNYTWLSLHAMQLLTEFKQRFENNHHIPTCWCQVRFQICRRKWLMSRTCRLFRNFYLSVCVCYRSYTTFSNYTSNQT